MVNAIKADLEKVHVRFGSVVLGEQALATGMMSKKAKPVDSDAFWNVISTAGRTSPV